MVALLARRDDVLPHVLAAAMARHHVIEGEVVTTAAAVLAGVIVPGEHFLARHLHDRSGPLHVVDETDDGGRLERQPLAGDEVAVLLDHTGLLLGEENDRPADVAHVERLEVQIEHKDIRVDYAHVPILGSARYD